MKKIIPWLMLGVLSGCATQAPQMEEVESAVSAEQQREAQQAALKASKPKALSLKRKIAVGRLSNEMVGVCCAQTPRISLALK